MRSEIWLGDVARAFAALRPQTAADRAAIARLLGFESQLEAAPAQPSHPPSAVPEAERAPVPERPVRRWGIPLVRPSLGRSARAQGATDERRLLVPVSRDPRPTVTWGQPALTVATTEQLSQLPPHIPLLPPRSTTVILQTLLGQPVPEGAVDVALTANQLAAQRPVFEMPRHERSSLRFGVQVLIDRGEGMEPFRRDQAELVGSIVRVFGRERVQLRYFSGSPFRAGAGPVWTWGRYRPPPPRTRVLILSDLGISARAEAAPADWPALARLLSARRCDAVCLVPYTSAHWPPTRQRPFRLVTWDRSITAPGLATGMS